MFKVKHHDHLLGAECHIRHVISSLFWEEAMALHGLRVPCFGGLHAQGLAVSFCCWMLWLDLSI